MKRHIRTTALDFLSVFFVLCCVALIILRLPYWSSRRLDGNTAESFTQRIEPVKVPGSSRDKGKQEKRELILAPIQVDFNALNKINEDIIGWIYCEDTVIDYPVLHGETNDTYLHTLYNREYSSSGSIFQDSANLKGFLDNNNILYGHHMADGSMFASLSKWQRQEYFDEHPAMWLLTPEQDYRMELFSAYTVSAYDATYTIFRGSSQELEQYLKLIRTRSAVESDIELSADEKYVLLSTCAYSFADARSVLHGKLVPVDSAGGKPLDNRQN